MRLNNPASAAQRAASGLLDELRVYGHEKFHLGGLCLDEAHLLACGNGRKRVRQQAKEVRWQDPACGAREDELHAWIGPTVSKSRGRLRPNSPKPACTAEQLEPSGRISRPRCAHQSCCPNSPPPCVPSAIAEAMLDSTDRIFDLIRAIKDYSYMDQAPIQEIDIRQGPRKHTHHAQSRLEACRDRAPLRA